MDDRQLGRPRLHLDGGEAARPEQPHLPHLPTALKTNCAPQDKVPRPPPPLRHAIASSERQPEDSQEMLGHANISETMVTYSHVLPSMQETAASAIENALS
jgi:integrase